MGKFPATTDASQTCCTPPLAKLFAASKCYGHQLPGFLSVQISLHHLNEKTELVAVSGITLCCHCISCLQWTHQTPLLVSIFISHDTTWPLELVTSHEG